MDPLTRRLPVNCNKNQIPVTGDFSIYCLFAKMQLNEERLFSRFVSRTCQSVKFFKAILMQHHDEQYTRSTRTSKNISKKDAI